MKKIYNALTTIGFVLGLSCDLSNASAEVVTDGLVLNYDFSSGSLPDADGVVHDLSPHRLNGVMRPIAASGSLPRTGWRAHEILQGDGQGGWITRPAQVQVLKHPHSSFTMPFGLIQMDNGEIVLQCSTERRGQSTRPVLTFSQDGGDTWSDFQVVEAAHGRPMHLADFGPGSLTFLAGGKRWFSDDYGRSWPRSVGHPRTKDGHSFHVEGNDWIDRDEQGNPTAILQLGWYYEAGKRHPKDDCTVMFRRSVDGGVTWDDEVTPQEWKFEMTHAGVTHLRGVSEGAIVRAANGWLVAALRTDVPPSYFDGPHDDTLEGTGISISRDNGRTWSKMNILFFAGRHHANLQRLPNGDLVCVMIVRADCADGKLASHRRGCDAIISHDNGLTWNLDRRYELDRFDFHRPEFWLDGRCGHIGSVVLNDGAIMTAYGHYLLGAAVLVRWRPDAEPARTLATDQQPPAGQEFKTLYDQTGQRGKEFEIDEEPGKPAQLRLIGSGWLQLPTDERLLEIDDNGTFEMIVRPEQRGHLPILFGGRGLTPNDKESTFLIGLEFNNPHSGQAIHSDQRLNREACLSTIRVNSSSTPPAAEPVLQQLALVMDQGQGRFYRDGKLFDKQEQIGVLSGSLFHFLRSRTEDLQSIRLGIGAQPGAYEASRPLHAAFLAVRVYDRPLSPEELMRNRATTLGLETNP